MSLDGGRSTEEPRAKPVKARWPQSRTTPHKIFEFADLSSFFKDDLSYPRQDQMDQMDANMERYEMQNDSQVRLRPSSSGHSAAPCHKSTPTRLVQPGSTLNIIACVQLARLRSDQNGRNRGGDA